VRQGRGIQQGHLAIACGVKKYTHINKQHQITIKPAITTTTINDSQA
jgi:hypothetical protein